MNRDEYIKWCEKCVNREHSLKGLLCSLTHSYADFIISCQEFQLDKKEGFEIERKFILNKYGNKRTSKIVKTRLYPSKEWLRKLNLPDQLIVRKESFKPVYGFILLTFVSFFALTIDYVFFQYKSSSTAFVFMFLSLAMIIFIFYQIRTYKQDDTPVLIISPEGIKIGGKKEFLWNEIQTFYLTVGGGRNRQDFLILKPILQIETKVIISNLEYSPKKIIHIIEKYKHFNRT